jgi:hypothetical protein
MQQHSQQQQQGSGGPAAAASPLATQCQIHAHAAIILLPLRSLDRQSVSAAGPQSLLVVVLRSISCFHSLDFVCGEKAAEVTAMRARVEIITLS